ncbi:hypothetical protein SLE2022_150160 [Rubroshorea leprosula]
MSTSMFLCDNLIVVKQNPPQTLLSLRNSSCFLVPFGSKRNRFSGFFTNAAKHDNCNNEHSKKRKRSWWQRFFFDDDGNWLGLKDDYDTLEEELKEGARDKQLSEGEKFEAWKRRAEAIIELREAQQDMRNEESRRWEDWIVDGDGKYASDWDDDFEELRKDPVEMVPEKGLVEIARDLILGEEDEDILYEDRVFRYASINSAKFLAALIIIPLVLDYVVHDYVLMPFLDRYVKTVPLAAELLDVRRSQKLEMVKQLKVEKARFMLEVEIGQAPPLSDEELWWELRHKALELRDEWRLENRKAFANIWSDMIFGISLFLLLFFNQSKVALLKFTGYKLFNNISDAGKAFLIIVIADILLGYHSELGWQAFLEIMVEHYGLQIDEAAITVFISVVPVFTDSCLKIWLFKFLPRLSPRVDSIFHDMGRH